MGMQGRSFRVFDTLINLVSKIGISGDKSIANQYALPAGATQADVEAAYRTSWLARKVIDIPPLDMTREWRNWQAEDSQIEDLEQAEKDFGIVKKTKRALTWARLYGGGALVLGVDQGNSDQPLIIESVRKGGLKFVHAVHRYQLTIRDMDRDPMSPGFGQPTMYQATGAQSGAVDIHPSRVIRFLGNEYPDDNNIGDGWSDSYWMTLQDIVTQNDALTAVIGALVQEAKVDVVHIPNLMEMLGTEEHEAKLLKRFTVAMTLKSLTNTLLLDGGADGKSGEVWDRKEMNFAGLPDILRLFLAMSAGAADIPATRLLGKSPDGMNATGDSDLRNYYDMLSSRQELDMWPQLTPFDKLLQQHLFGKVDENIYFESAPLWQMTPAEKAEISSKKANTAKIHNDMNIMPSEAMAQIVQNQLIEDGVYPGIEAALEEFGTQPDEAPTPITLALPAPGTPIPGQKRLPPPVPVGRTQKGAGAVATDGFRDANVRSLDPTNTGAVRKTWKLGVSRLMKQAESRIKALVKGAEGVGVEVVHYRDLLQQAIGGRDWFGKHVVRAYRRGLDDASTRLGSTMRLPFSENDVQTIRAIGNRVMQDFAHVADDLSQQLYEAVRSSVTVDEALARVSERMKSIGVNRGQTVASVHVVRTHALASLNHYRASGVKKVGLDIEGVRKHTHDAEGDELLQFATAGDDDVCPECEDLEGQIFDIEEAQGVIPVHPNCRCAWIPVRDPGGRFNPRISTGDASPRSLFISRKVINAGDIVAWARTQGFKTMLPADELHVTVCHSRTPVDWIAVGEAIAQDEAGRIVIRPGGARLVERLGTATVLLFNSAMLAYRHEEIRRAGALFDYDSYQPHVTLTYGPTDMFNLEAIKPYDGELILGPEIFQEINDFQPPTEEYLA